MVVYESDLLDPSSSSSSQKKKLLNDTKLTSSSSSSSSSSAMHNELIIGLHNDYLNSNKNYITLPMGGFAGRFLFFMSYNFSFVYYYFY